MRKLLLAAATIGGFLIAVPVQAASAAPAPDAGAQVAAASGSPPSVVLTAATPTLPQYRVVAGDTLWGIGVRFQRGWPALAAFNHIPNPDLIYVGQVFTIPPATYTPSAPLTTGTPVHAQYAYAPTKQQVSTPVSHTSTYHVPPMTTSSGSSGGYTGVWACIAQHESGGNVHINTGNGFYGGLQFTAQTWAAYGGQGSAADASAAEQQAVANRVVAAAGGSYGAWPNTSRMCGV